MYFEYFGLDRPPFRITPDPSLFFTGGANGRGVVLEALLYAIGSGEGILKVVGEVGSGKTMLCRMLEQRLPEHVEVVYLANPKLTPHEILYAVAFELRLDVTQDTPRLVLMQKLQDYLLQQHAANRTVLVIIEEAQSMPMETLEEIRLFSNLETHQHKLMQIILFGQPELDANLLDKNIRQLRERITHSFYLNPLTTEEVSDYIRHRLQSAGCQAPQIFSAKAEKLIAKASGGLTRRINIIADKALLAAYSESATSTRPRGIGSQLQPVVDVRHVKAAIRDSDYRPMQKQSWKKWLIVGSAVFAVVVITLLAMLVYGSSASAATPPSLALERQENIHDI
jgi:MSHA biogenesis protein MshM